MDNKINYTQFLTQRWLCPKQPKIKATTPLALSEVKAEVESNTPIPSSLPIKPKLPLNPVKKLGEKTRHLEKKFGLTVEQYNQMLQTQNNVCAICGQPERQKDRRGNSRKLCIDHNHTTGQIRDLLCSNCNFVIGNAFESEAILFKAVEYLRIHKIMTTEV